MSHKRKLTSLVSGLALGALIASFAGGCGGEDGDDGEGGGTCGVIGARLDALKLSSDTLGSLALEIKGDVVAACAAIAGMPVPANPTDPQVTSLCQAASAKIDTELNANVQIVVVPPVCTVNAEAQLDCEGSCYAEADVSCEPGNVEARCEPGELSVVCQGSCEGSLSCEGSVEVAVACEGTCSGECTGTCGGTCKGECDGTCSGGTNQDGSCNGTCTGECKGQCTAKCTGDCRGSCEFAADATIECEAEARCHGECSGTATAPHCEATLEPPECEGSAAANCNADCEGSASLNADCTDAGIEIVGDVDASFATTLKAQLPALLVVVKRSELAGTTALHIATELPKLSADVTSCTLQLGGSAVAQLTAAITASAAASATASVSFKASVDVSASATGGT
jgi:hypothetical protein